MAVARKGPAAPGRAVAPLRADCYFLINDGPARVVWLDTKALAYRAAVDAVTDEPLSLGAGVALDGYSGRWLRCEKESTAPEQS